MDLNEGVGPLAYDSIGTNNGVLTNGVSWDLGKWNTTGLYFDGSNDYLDFVQIPEITVSGTFTISFWFKPYSISKGTWDRIFSQTKTGTDRVGIYQYNANLGYSHYSGSYSSIWGANTLTTAWHFITAVCDSGTKTIYVDGVSFTNSGDNVNPGGIADTVIGCTTDKTDFFRGTLDDIRVYNRALLSSDVAELYIWEPTTDLTDIEAMLFIFGFLGLILAVSALGLTLSKRR